MSTPEEGGKFGKRGEMAFSKKNPWAVLKTTRKGTKSRRVQADGEKPVSVYGEKKGSGTESTRYFKKNQPRES